MITFCLSEEELERWPNLPPDRAIHHRTCRDCENKLRNLIKPKFVWAAENAGRAANVPAKTVLDMDSKETSSYPGPDCLQPHDFEEFRRTGKLNPRAQDHLQRCIACTVNIEMARPPKS